MTTTIQQSMQFSLFYELIKLCTCQNLAQKT